nr:hypothetical protein K4M19_00342 [Agrobacterium fabrum]
MDAAGWIGTSERTTLLVEIEEPPSGVHATILKEVEQAIGLVGKPVPMIAKVSPLPAVLVLSQRYPSGVDRLASFWRFRDFALLRVDLRAQ